METDPSIQSTWRIGDGTAPFIFIYKALPTFQNMILFGTTRIFQILLKKNTLNLVKSENEPRFERIREYLDLIDFNYDQTINTILELSPYKK